MHRGPSPEETYGYDVRPLPTDAPIPPIDCWLEPRKIDETLPPPGPTPPEAICLQGIQQARNQLPDISSTLKPSHAWKKIQKALEQPPGHQAEAAQLIQGGMQIAELISNRLSNIKQPEDSYSGMYIYQLDRALAFRPMLEHIVEHPNLTPGPEISEKTARNIARLIQQLEDLCIANLEGIRESPLRDEEDVLIVAYLALRSHGITVQPIAPSKQEYRPHRQSPQSIHLYIHGIPLRIVSTAEDKQQYPGEEVLEIGVYNLWQNATAGLSGNLGKLQRDAHKAIFKEAVGDQLGSKKARLLDQGTHYILEQVQQHRAIHV